MPSRWSRRGRGGDKPAVKRRYIILPALGFVVGFAVLYFGGLRLPKEYSIYLAVAVIAGLDAVFGAVRAGLSHEFDPMILVTGFLFNAMFACLLVYVGDLIGVELYLAAVILQGGRILTNFSLIRRHLLGKLQHPDPDRDPGAG
jgi:small basic protein